MENKFFTFNYPPIREYEISTMFNSDSIAQEIADEAFLNFLSKITHLSRGKKKNVCEFLLFQFENTKANRLEFLEHLDKIFTPRQHILKPYNLAIGYVLNWIKSTKLANVASAATTKKLKATKPLPPFDSIIRDKTQMEKIIQRLQIKGILGKDLTWKGIKSPNSELVALSFLLAEANVITMTNKTRTGRIFMKKFQVAMDERNFRTSPNEKTLQIIEDELKGII